MARLLEVVPACSLTVFTGVGSTGLTVEEKDAIERKFDTTRLFLDVWIRNDRYCGPGNGMQKCAIM